MKDTDILTLIEVTLNDNSTTLILTTEAVLVLSTDEDVQEAAHDLNDIDCFGCEEDPTKLTLTFNPDRDCNDTSSIALSYGGVELEKSVKERVAQFVMDTSGAVQCTVSDFETETDDFEDIDESGSKRKKKSHHPEQSNNESDKKVTVFASPVNVSAFLGLFEMAKRQNKRNQPIKKKIKNK